MTESIYASDGEYPDTVFLLEIVEDENGRTVNAEDEIKELISPFAKMPSDSLFCENTAKELEKLLLERASAFGYRTESAIQTVYAIKERDKVNKRLILDSTEPLLPDNNYENLTDTEIDPLSLGYLCFGTVSDGKILSAASENPHPDDSTVIDIGVETSPEHRGHRYALSNVAALTYYLLDPGMTVTYTVDDSNVPSHKIAQKVGFTRIEQSLIIAAIKEN